MVLSCCFVLAVYRCLSPPLPMKLMRSLKIHDRIFSNRPKSSIPSRLLYDFKDIAFARYSEYWRQVKSVAVLHSKSQESSVISKSERRRNRPGVWGIVGCFQCVGLYPLAQVNRINGLNAKVERVAKQSDEYLETILQEHMDQEKGVISCYGESVEGKEMDFVDILRDNMTGFSIHKDTVKALISDMFVAGIDTTYTVLEWAMTELLRHQQVMKELQNEVSEIASGKSEIMEDDIEKMHYLKAVIKATLWLHTPVPLLVPRESTKVVKILGYDVLAGTQVIINAWATGQYPLLWEEPKEFRPERFLNCSIDFKGVHFQFILFGAGRRICPGIQFAIAINELALAKIVWKFDFALPGRERGENMDMIESTGMTAHKKLPLLAVATPYCC